jgi:hypothetical protein
VEFCFRTPYLFWQNRKNRLVWWTAEYSNENLSRLRCVSQNRTRVENKTIRFVYDNPKWFNKVIELKSASRSVIIDKLKAQGIKLRAGSVLSK